MTEVVAGMYSGAGGVMSCADGYSVPGEAVYVYGEADGVVSSAAADEYSVADGAVKVYCGVAGYASKDATAVCSVPGGAVVMSGDSEFAPCGVDGRVAGAMKLCAGSTRGDGPERLGDYRQDNNEVTIFLLACR